LPDCAKLTGWDANPAVAAAVNFQVRRLTGINLNDGFQAAGLRSLAVLASLAKIKIDL
jgi:hypothetical protein